MTRRLATICARGGSKGVPGKNIRMLAGKPLIAHTIDQARASGMFATVAVSSDSEEILEVARRFGADVLVHRPDDLATDSAPKIPVIRHCLAQAEAGLGTAFDEIADLAVTSPLRSAADIVGALNMLAETGATNIVSSQITPHSPYYTVVELAFDGHPALSKPPPQNIFCRQDAPVCYALNGAVYAWTRAALMDEDLPLLAPSTRLFVMPSARSIDIDEEIDFRVAECLIASGGTDA